MGNKELKPILTMKSVPLFKFMFDNKEDSNIKVFLNDEMLDKILDKINMKTIVFVGSRECKNYVDLNSLIYIWNYRNNHSKGYFDPLPFENGCSSLEDFNEENSFRIYVEPIKLPGIDQPVYFIDASGLNILRSNTFKNRFEIKLHNLIEKIYGILLSISDAFILSLPPNINYSDEEVIFMDKTRMIMRALESLKEDLFYIPNDYEIKRENFFVFKKDSTQLDEHNERKFLDQINSNQPLADFLFTIDKVPDKLLETGDFDFLKLTTYKHNLRKALKTIAKKIKINEPKTFLNILYMLISSINNEDESFSNILKIEFALNKLKQNIIDERIRIVQENRNILNDNNFRIFNHEIIQEESRKLVENALKREKRREEILLQILSCHKSKKKEEQLKDKICTDNINKDFDNISNFYHLKVKDVKTLHNEISRALLMKLYNGDEFLIYKDKDKHLKTINFYFINADWEILFIEDKKNTDSDTDVEDACVNYLYDDLNNVPKIDTSIQIPNTYNFSDSYNTLMSGANYLGGILTNAFYGYYDNKTAWDITKEITLDSTITTAFSALNTNMPWLGTIIDFYYHGISAYNSMQTIFNKSSTTDAKTEVITKTWVKNGVLSAIGTGTFTSSVMYGSALGSIVPFIGTSIGAALGSVLGAITSGLSVSIAGQYIDSLWKVLDANKVLVELIENYNSEGYWNNPKEVCSHLKIDYDEVLNQIPDELKSLTIGKAKPEEIWTAIIILNVLSFLEIQLNTNEQRADCEKMAKTTLNFMKNNQDDKEIILVNYLPNLRKILEGWMGVLS